MKSNALGVNCKDSWIHSPLESLLYGHGRSAIFGIVVLIFRHGMFLHSLTGRHPYQWGGGLVVVGSARLACPSKGHGTSSWYVPTPTCYVRSTRSVTSYAKSKCTTVTSADSARGLQKVFKRPRESSTVLKILHLFRNFGAPNTNSTLDPQLLCSPAGWGGGTGASLGPGGVEFHDTLKAFLL